MSSFQYGTVERVQIIHDNQEVANHAIYKESIRVKDVKQVHAEYMKLEDLYREGKITEFGVRTFCDKSGQLFRMEKLWMT